MSLHISNLGHTHLTVTVLPFLIFRFFSFFLPIHVRQISGVLVVWRELMTITKTRNMCKHKKQRHPSEYQTIISIPSWKGDCSRQGREDVLRVIETSSWARMNVALYKQLTVSCCNRLVVTIVFLPRLWITLYIF